MFDKLLTQFAAHIPCSKGTPLGEPGRLRRRCGRRATRVARHSRLEIAIAAELAAAPFRNDRLPASNSMSGGFASVAVVAVGRF